MQQLQPSAPHRPGVVPQASLASGGEGVGDEGLGDEDVVLNGEGKGDAGYEALLLQSFVDQVSLPLCYRSLPYYRSVSCDRPLCLTAPLCLTIALCLAVSLSSLARAVWRISLPRPARYHPSLSLPRPAGYHPSLACPLSLLLYAAPLACISIALTVSLPYVFACPSTSAHARTQAHTHT